MNNEKEIKDYVNRINELNKIIEGKTKDGAEDGSRIIEDSIDSDLISQKAISTPRVNRRYITAFLIILFALFSGFLFFKYGGQIIGLVSGEITYTEKLNLSFNHSDLYTLNLKRAPLSLELSGYAIGRGNFKVYVLQKNNKYLILDTRALENQGMPLITGRVVKTNETEINLNETIIIDNKSTEINKTEIKLNETLINETINKTSIEDESLEINETLIKLNEHLINETINETEINLNETIIIENKSIEINKSEIELNKTEIKLNETLINETINKSINVALSYKSGTKFDTDNNGIEGTDWVIDFTVEDSSFNWNVDKSRLCTRWEVYSLDNNTLNTVCYGSKQCCNFMDLEPYLESWNAPFNIQYGKNSAGFNNTLSARVIYADYRLDVGNLYADIVSSEWSSLPAIFVEGFVQVIKFENICVDTCSLVDFSKDLTIAVELEEGVIVNLTGVRYRAKLFEEANETTTPVESVTIVNETTLQYKAVVGQPVKWVKRIKLSNKTTDFEVKLPKGLINVSIKKITEEYVTDVKVKEVEKQKPFSLITGGVIGKEEETNETGFVIGEEVKEIEIEYYTEAPQLFEERISPYKKRIVVSSNVHYEDILTFSYLPKEAKQENIRLYWLLNNTRKELEFEPFDFDKNGFVDYIAWVTPYLSNQTFEIDIVILNVQSYPTVGGNWTVRFTTTGVADLSIAATNGTSWTNYSEEGFDLKFLKIKCGNDDLTYKWINNSVFIPNYECDEAGYEISKVLTAGTHTLMFKFGDAVKYAKNLALVTGTVTNLTIWDSTDSATKYAGDNIYFYANFSNLTSGAPITGAACNISHNYTGTFSESFNMSYNATTNLYWYNKSFNNTKTIIFNVTCDGTGTGYEKLNATDIAIITNSDPVLVDTPPSGITLYEDTRYIFDVNATDSDVNDNLSLSYSEDSSVFEINSSTGLIDFTPTPSNVGIYTGVNATLIIVKDRQEAYAAALWSYTIASVNDPPIITPAMIFQNLTEDVLYIYDVNATDEENNTPFTFGSNTSMFTINSTTGLINFTPTNDNVGNYTINMTVNDSAGGIGFEIVNFTVWNVNDPPVLVSIGSLNAVEGVLYTYDVNASDIDRGDDATLVFGSNSTIFTINSSTGLINFTPTNADVGNYSMNISVNDTNGGIDYEVINFTVINVNNPPVLTSIGNLNATYNLTFNYDVNASDPDIGDSITYGTNTSIFTINPSTGIISFTPGLSSIGNYSLNISVNDTNGGIDYEVISFTIFNNSAPVLFAIGSLSGTENIAFIYDVNATDSDPGDNATLVFSSNASIFTINPSTGLINFVPTNNEVGNFTINITVRDRLNAMGYEAVNFTIVNINENPVLVPIGNKNSTQNQSFVYDVNASDPDPGDNATLVFSSNASIFTINSSTGLINFTPTNANVGNYSINISVNDSSGGSDFEVINFTVWNVNDPPVLVSIGSLNAAEGVLYTYDVNASDIDRGDDATLVFGSNSTIFTINSSTGLINFTPTNADVGNYSMNISVNDTNGGIDYEVINFTISTVNTAPNMTLIYLYGTPKSTYTVEGWANITDFPNNLTSINVSENKTYLFNHTTTDAQNDTLTYQWYVNATLNSTNNSLSYDFGWYDSGSKNITLIVSDGQLSVRFYWNVTINNTNRQPRFGVLTHTSYTDFSSGSVVWANITREPGNITIAQNSSGEYYLNGTYTSGAVDMQADYNKVQFTNISWEQVLPAGTNITVQTRTSSDNSTWNNWSIAYTNSSNQIINSTSSKYIQYMVNLTTTNTSATPVLTSITIKHEIPDLTMSEDSRYNNWIDLDNYFTEDDADDTLTYNATNTTNINITIDSSTHKVSLIPSANWYGNETIIFTLNDSKGGLALSNNISITVTNVEEAVTTQTLYVRRTRTVFQYRTRPIRVTVPRYMKIIVPQPLETQPDNSIKAPIILQNMEKSTISGISMSATSSTEDVSLSFSKTRIKELGTGGEETTYLTITPKKDIMKPYEVIVKAKADSPEYEDSIILSITPLESIVQQLVVFVEDLLSTNPECLELNELLLEARNEINKGDYESAEKTLNDVIDSCRYLISKEVEWPEIEKPKELTIILEKLLTTSWLYALVGAVLVLWIFVYKLRKKRRNY